MTKDRQLMVVIQKKADIERPRLGADSLGSRRGRSLDVCRGSGIFTQTRTFYPNTQLIQMILFSVKAAV